MVGDRRGRTLEHMRHLAKDSSIGQEKAHRVTYKNDNMYLSMFIKRCVRREEGQLTKNKQNPLLP